MHITLINESFVSINLKENKELVLKERKRGDMDIYYFITSINQSFMLNGPYPLRAHAPTFRSE